MDFPVLVTNRGTSPLTRGKPNGLSGFGDEQGNIPAHAGKTLAQRPARTSTTEHPRSRGENVGRALLLGSLFGTSPLTRGKPPNWPLPRVPPRNIPAHAGKTLRGSYRFPAKSEHPRSRGENVSVCRRRLWTRGTSPLTRGKHGLKLVGFPTPRNIPAHAGKTNASTSSSPTHREHPRSRGENPPEPTSLYGEVGTSPLTRGKHGATMTAAQTLRNIPAHAGKTRGRV